MPTNYPAALDALSNPLPGQSQNASRTHSEQHSDLNDAMEAVQATLGATGAPGTPLSLRGDLASTATGKGAKLLGFKAAAATAVSRDTFEKLNDLSLSLGDWGVVGSGDETTKVQQAIDAVVAAGGGTLIVPRTVKTIRISAPLVAAGAGVLLRAEDCNDLSTNTNGSGDSKPRFLWIGTSNPGYMFTVRPATVGQTVWGGGSEGIEWDGASAIAGGVLLDNVKYGLFDGRARAFTYTCVAFNSVSGSAANFGQQCWCRRLEWVHGASAATYACNGLTLRGNGTTVPSTQHRVGVIAGLARNGYGIDIGETDNCVVEVVTTAVEAGGTGGSVRTRTGGAGPADSNVFNYVAGAIHNDASGTRVLHWNSEGGGLQGTGQIHFEVLDYVNTGRVFTSHKYKLREKLLLEPGAFIGDAGTSNAKFGAQWQVPTFLSAGTGTLSCVIPPSFDRRDGTIEGVEIWIGSNGTSGGNYRFQAAVSTAAALSSAGIVTPEASYLDTQAAGGQYVPVKITLPATLAVSNEDIILLQITRFAIDALDTNADDACFLGARLLFRGTGPNSAGSGSLASVPSWT